MLSLPQASDAAVCCAEIERQSLAASLALIRQIPEFAQPSQVTSYLNPLTDNEVDDMAQF